MKIQNLDFSFHVESFYLFGHFFFPCGHDVYFRIRIILKIQ